MVLWWMFGHVHEWECRLIRAKWHRKEGLNGLKHYSHRMSTKTLLCFDENTCSSFHSNGEWEWGCCLIILLCLMLPIVLPFAFFQMSNLLQQQIRFEGELPQGKNEELWTRGNKSAFFAQSDTFVNLYPYTDLINVKTCKNSRDTVREQYCPVSSLE